MSEGYPENWKHAVVHFNPETKSMHFDKHFDSRSDEDIEIISGYWEGLKSENKRLKVKCVEAEKLPNGQCRGFQVSRFDDEPIEQCKNCQKFDLYDPEELVEDCPEDWDEEGEHDD